MSRLFMRCRTKLLSTFRFEKRNVFVPHIVPGEKMTTGTKMLLSAMCKQEITSWKKTSVDVFTPA